MGLIKLESSDGKQFEVDRNVLKCIGLIEQMLQHFGDNVDEHIIIRNVDSDMLEKVLKWATHANKEKNFKEKFTKENQRCLFDLMDVANYMDFNDMMDYLCNHIVDKMKNKTADVIREEFAIAES